MSTETETIEALVNSEYKWGFVTEIEADTVPRGLNEETIRLISAKKDEPEFMLEWRLNAYRHWLTLEESDAEPTWANVHYPPIDYQSIVYYSAPMNKKDGPKSLDEVDPELLRTYEKLGIPLREREILSGVAIDAVFDSVSVATTFRDKLGELGIIFCSFSEAVQEHPELVVSDMKKAVRTNKVFVDWSQNDEHKTTISVYSLRARERPTVSTPVTWEEVEQALKKKDAERLVFEAKDVLARVEKMGDLFEPVQTQKQNLPQLAGLAAASELESEKEETEGIGIAARAEARPRPQRKTKTKGESAAGKHRKL